MTPEEQARIKIDSLLEQAGWDIQDAADINLYASVGVALREFSLKPGHGAADYLLFINQRVLGVVEANPEVSPFVGVQFSPRSTAQVCRAAMRRRQGAQLSGEELVGPVVGT